MKTIITLCTFVVCATLYAVEESPDDIARRVITDTTPAFTAMRPVHLQPGSLSHYNAEKDPKEIAYDEAVTQADRIFESYILGDSVSELVRIACAIRVLASKRTHLRLAEESGVQYHPDRQKGEQWLRDFLALSARLNQLQQDAEGGDGDA